jgi:hypothetical protein
VFSLNGMAGHGRCVVLYAIIISEPVNSGCECIVVANTASAVWRPEYPRHIRKALISFYLFLCINRSHCILTITVLSP